MGIGQFWGKWRHFWATVCKTVRPMLSERCLSACHSLSVCPAISVFDVGVLWSNGWTDQDETWHPGRPWPWPHCVRLGPSYPSPKGHSPLPTIFGPYLLRPNGCINQDVTWYGARPRPPGDFVLDEDPAPPPQKGGGAPSKKSPTFIVAKRLDGSRWYLAWKQASAQATLRYIALDGDPAPPSLPP